MRNLSLLLVPALAGTLLAQSNSVVGLDGRLDLVDQFSFQGHRGAAYPNGESGFAMLNTMCNPGTVNIPWQAAMQPNHPKFGFLAVRVYNDRIEQISDRSHCKHAFTSTNFSGSCGSCISPGTGSLMGVHCSDTYGVGNNADRNWLGPANELDPWLGTWNPVGSYFDQGDPNVGAPGNSDGARSPSYSGSDAVKNRVTIKDSDLGVAGASYFYGIHLMHQGEPVANRGDNLASRGFTASWTGSSWSTSNNSVGQVWGSILQHWSGSSLNSGGNGNDDGRFFVAVKTRSLGGGNYHYEYAVHNVDNSRGGATFRIPVQAGATVSNFTFGDIDDNVLNDWTATFTGSEVSFAAPAGNSLEWNTIYNFGFDCNVAPGGGGVILDQARVGPGALSVTVISTVPGGVPVATNETIGQGCGASTCLDNMFYEMYANTGAFDLANSGLSMVWNGAGYNVGNGTATFVPVSGSSTQLGLGDDSQVTINLPFTFPYLGGTTTTLRVCSNGFVAVADNGTNYVPSATALTSGAQAWYGAWTDLNPAASGSGKVFVDNSATEVRVTFNGVYRYGTTSASTFQFVFAANGDVHLLWQAMNPAGNTLVGWSVGNGATAPAARDISATRGAGWTLCNTQVAGLALAASARPVIGTSVNLITSNIPTGSPFGAVIQSLQQALPPADLTSQGMPGCFGYVVGGVTQLFLVAPASTTSSLPFGIPNDPAFSGLAIVNQSFTYSPGLTPLGVISSNGVILTVGAL